MAIRTWFTQPENSFASFYYYNTGTLNMVRIRLELNRGDHGRPKVILTPDRQLGFGGEEAITYGTDVSDWCVTKDGEIFFQKEDDDDPVVFPNVPEVGKYVIDFTLDHDDDRFVHHGNKVSNAPRLPFCSPYIAITATVLTDIAEKAIQQGAGFTLCEYNATECDLVKALVQIHRPG